MAQRRPEIRTPEGAIANLADRVRRLEETNSRRVLPPGYEVRVDANGNLVIVRVEDGFQTPLSIDSVGCVDLEYTTDGLQAGLVIDPASTASVTCSEQGLRVDETFNSASDTDSVDLTLDAAGDLSADLAIDAASPIPITTSDAGVSVGPVGPSGGGEATTVSDSTTVDLTLTGFDITAAVIPNTLQGLQNTASGVAAKIQGAPASVAPTVQPRVRFTNAGDFTDLARGGYVTTVANGGQANIPSGAGGNNASFSRTVTNNNAHSVIVTLSVKHALVLTSQNNPATSYTIDMTMSLNTSGFAGGATLVPSTYFGCRVSELCPPIAGTNPTGQFAWTFHDEIRVLMPSGSSFVVAGVLLNNRNLAAGSWFVNVADGSYYQTLAMALHVEHADAVSSELSGVSVV